MVKYAVHEVIRTSKMKAALKGGYTYTGTDLLYDA